ncbi:MAG: HAD family hydrolase [Pseudomonadota bacterium]
MAEILRALLFDKDGTLLDFDATWGAVTEAVIARIAPDAALGDRMAELAGYDRGARRFRPGSPIVAGATTDTAEIWAPLLNGRSISEIADHIDAVVAEITGPDTLVPAVEDMPVLLSDLRRAGLALGIATHDSQANAQFHIEALGLARAFSFIAGYDSGHGLKPGPGMLMAFSQAVAVPANQIAVVGDSVHDLGMARSGGALAIGVLTGPAEHADLAPHADHVLPSIGALPALLRDQ